MSVPERSASVEPTATDRCRDVAERFWLFHDTFNWRWADKPVQRVDLPDGGAVYRAHVPSVDELEALLVRLAREVVGGAPVAHGPRVVAYRDGGLVVFSLVVADGVVDGAASVGADWGGDEP